MAAVVFEPSQDYRSRPKIAASYFAVLERLITSIREPKAKSLKSAVFHFGNIFACPLTFLWWREFVIGSLARRKIKTRANINMISTSACAE
jgi:hypothetical protein